METSGKYYRQTASVDGKYFRKKILIRDAGNNFYFSFSVFLFNFFGRKIYYLGVPVIPLETPSNISLVKNFSYKLIIYNDDLLNSSFGSAPKSKEFLPTMMYSFKLIFLFTGERSVEDKNEGALRSFLGVCEVCELKLL